VETEGKHKIPGLLMEYTPSQEEVLSIVQNAVDTKRREFVYWMGGVRAGKSYGSALAFMLHQKYRRNGQYIVLAYTATQAHNIYGPYFEAIGEQMGVDVKVKQWKIEVGDGNVFFLKGGHGGGDRTVQGMTCDGLLADEVVLLDRDSLHQAEARVSKPGGLRIYTTNKSNKYHWTAKYYIKRIENGSINGNVIDCTIEENQYIDRDYIAERSAEYDGNTLKRFMDNEFTLDGKPIYNVMLANDKTFLPGEYAYIVYAHPQGVETLKVARYYNEGDVCVHIEDGYSNDNDFDILTFLPNGRASGMILLNNEASGLCRSLRRSGFYVRGYRVQTNEERAQRIITACREGRVTLNEQAEDMIEAIQTYSEFNRSDFPIMTAFEAIAHVL